MFPKKGKVFPSRIRGLRHKFDYASAIAAALQQELGNTHQAIKTVMRWTNASERTVKNWFAGTSGPSGKHLLALVRHSDSVFEAFLILAGREQAVAAKKLLDAHGTLVEMFELIVDLTIQEPD